MNRLQTAFRQLRRDLDGIEVSWAVVGGLALAARGEPRPTRDIDVAIAAVDDGDAERCVRALVSRGYRIFLVLERQQGGELATVRLFVPGKGRSPVIADLLFRSCGIEEVVVAGATRVPLEGQRDVPVVSRAALVAMKLLSESDDRPRDRQDLVDLLRLPGLRSRQRVTPLLSRRRG